MNRVARALGRRIRSLRLARGLSQEQLAEAANLSLNAVGSFERGQRFPRGKSLQAILDVLGADADRMARTLENHAREDAPVYLESLGLPPALRELVILLMDRPQTDALLVLDVARRILGELDRR